MATKHASRLVPQTFLDIAARLEQTYGHEPETQGIGERYLTLMSTRYNPRMFKRLGTVQPISNPVKPKIPCPRCEGTQTRKSGFNQQGKQQIYCLSCKCIVAIGSTIHRSKTRTPCPYCQGRQTKRNGKQQSTGKTRFHCNDCRKGFFPQESIN
jgi:hypothetical protein